MADPNLYSTFFATAHLWDPDALDHPALAATMDPNLGGAALLDADNTALLVHRTASLHPIVIGVVDDAARDYITVLHSPRTIAPIAGAPPRTIDGKIYYLMGNDRATVTPVVTEDNDLWDSAVTRVHPTAADTAATLQALAAGVHISGPVAVANPGQNIFFRKSFIFPTDLIDPLMTDDSTYHTPLGFYNKFLLPNMGDPTWVASHQQLLSWWQGVSTYMLGAAGAAVQEHQGQYRQHHRASAHGHCR